MKAGRGTPLILCPTGIARKRGKIGLTRAEENERHNSKQRKEYRKRIEHKAEKARHLDIRLDGLRPHHEVGGVSQIGQRAHKHAAARDGGQNLIGAPLAA